MSGRVNSWVEFSFAIPQKLYARFQVQSQSPWSLCQSPHLGWQEASQSEEELVGGECGLEAESGEAASRPYHALLLLEETAEVVGSLPLDASPALLRLLRHLSPLKSLETLAADLDLPLSQVQPPCPPTLTPSPAAPCR